MWWEYTFVTTITNCFYGYRINVNFKCEALLQRGVCRFCHCLQIHNGPVYMKTDLGSIKRAHGASFVLCVRVCVHAREAWERDHMLGLSVQAAWSHSLWSAGVTVIVLWLFASLRINWSPFYTTQSDFIHCLTMN